VWKIFDDSFFFFFFVEEFNNCGKSMVNDVRTTMAAWQVSFCCGTTPSRDGKKEGMERQNSASLR